MHTIVEARAELFRHRLAKPVGGSAVASVDLLFVTLRAGDDRTGCGFSYVLGGRDDLPLRAARLMLERILAEARAEHPIALWRRIAATFNRTGGGPYLTALAAVDVAAWDLYARGLGVPIGIAMGGAPRSVPVYGSGGFFAGQDPDEAAAVAAAYVRRGVRAVKPRAAAAAGDARLLRAVAEAAGPAGVMVDANEKGTPATAMRLVRAAAAVDALFVEEPLPATDVAAYRDLARRSPVTLATGEHLRSSAEAAQFLRARLCGVIQPDLQAMGGLTECLRTAQFAEHCNVEVSPHFLPGLFVQLAAAAPNVTWLEDFPLLEPLFDGFPAMGSDGMLALPETPGHGLSLASGVRTSLEVLG